MRTEVLGRGTLPGLCARCLPLTLRGRWGSRTKPSVLTTRLLILVETSPLLLILLSNSLHVLASLQIKVEFKSGAEEGFVANQVHGRWQRTHHPQILRFGGINGSQTFLCGQNVLAATLSSLYN